MDTDPRLPSPPDVIRLRTAGRRWNNVQIYGEFAALWFFLMTKNDAKPTHPVPEWPSLLLDYRVNFGFAPRAIESGKRSEISTLGCVGERT